MRSFGYLWASAGLSNLADGVLKVGAPLLAVSLTRAPAEVALVGTATTLPWLLLALHAGAVADRADRRRIMLLANAFRTLVLVAASALVLLGVMNLWLLVAAVLLAGVAEVFADTSAQAVLPMTVPQDRLAWANSRIVGAQTVGNDFLGAPLAGLLVALLPAAILGAPGLLYGVAGLLLLGLRGRFAPATSGDRSPLRTGIREGLSYLWTHGFLRRLAVAAGLMNLAYAGFFAVFVLWVVGPGSRMGLEPAAYGLVMTAFAAGALAGSALCDRVVGMAGEGRTLAGAWLGNSLLLIVPVLAPHPVALYPTAVLWGVTNAFSNVTVISMRQRIIPEQLLGRVNSAYRLIGMGGMPVGAALAGLLGTAAGLPAVFLVALLVCLAAVALVWKSLTGSPVPSPAVVE